MLSINSCVLKRHKNYSKISDDGTINTKESIKEIVKNNYSIAKYKECIKYINLAIKEGIIDLKDDFSIHLSTTSQSRNESLKSNKNPIVIQRDPDEPPYVNLLNICRNNVNKLYNVYLSVFIYTNGNAALAYSEKVAYWTSKVREGGV